jgi:hypothetical protein
MWLAVDYEMVSAFSLRPSNTTSNGGKSLLSPTPYAIKMALLDRAIRQSGLDFGQALFPLIRDLNIWLHLPRAVAVNRTFQKVLRSWDRKDGWTSTISQREYCFHAGNLGLLLSSPAGEGDSPPLDDLIPLLMSINYFGRRGSFAQYLEAKIYIDFPNGAWLDLCQSPEGALSLGFLQRMDDMRPDASFEDVSNFTAKGNKDGGRIYRNIVFPYRMKHHGFNHTVYEYEV